MAFDNFRDETLILTIVHMKSTLHAGVTYQTIYLAIAAFVSRDKEMSSIPHGCAFVFRTRHI